MNRQPGFEGLTCPHCGSTVPIPEGESIVICSFCNLRSIVQGAAGLIRYHLPAQINREDALGHWQHFLSSSLAIERKARRLAKSNEVFLVHLPFWHVSGEGLGWGFGKKKVGSGKSRRYIPKEVHVAQRLTWNKAACDVSEFGMNRVAFSERAAIPFQVDELHRSGMVFEPVGSAEETLAAAQAALEAKVRKEAHLENQTQLFVRMVNFELSLVYYPLWVVRYLVLGRAFQVVVDANTGQVLYGKAPGSLTYRAAALVLGFLLGAILAIDLPALLLTNSNNASFLILALSFLAGLLVMYTGWRIFRYREHYEYQRFKTANRESAAFEMGLPHEARELLNQLMKKGKLLK